jgi:predicted RecB family nuclease
MGMSAKITAAVFAAYLKCPTKGYLSVHGEKPPDTFVADTRGLISAAYRARAVQELGPGLPAVVSIEFLRAAGDPAREAGTTLFVDCETASYACDQPESARRGRLAREALRPSDFVPILYFASARPDQSDHLLVCFGALAIGQSTGSGIPPSGKIIYGEKYRCKSVRIADHLPRARQVIETLASFGHATEPPRLILNKHCPVCDFQSRCRALAVERDDLSLLGAMTAKERARCEEKGISTITQLSYGYRPRRRRRLKSTALPGGSPIRHDHKLKALAIKKGCTHVVGSPSLSIQGTPVFMAE